MRFKKLTLPVCTLFSLILFAVPLLTSKDSDPKVYVTRTGEKYHRDGCQYLRQSRTPKSLSAAVAAGYTACKRCKPPEPNSEGKADSGQSSDSADAKSSYVSSRCAATTKKGTRCKRKASKGSSYCWQHNK